MSDIIAPPTTIAPPPLTPADITLAAMQAERDRAARYRTERNTLREKIPQLEAAATALRAETDAKIAAAETAANTRVMRAEVRILAVAAGINDAGDVALLDMATLKLDADGNVTGAAEAIAAMKAAKPYLFKGATTTANPPSPKPGDHVPKNAKDMTDAEYAGERQRMASSGGWEAAKA